MKKTLLTALMVAAAFVSISAHAASTPFFTFTSDAASGKTTPFLAQSNVAVETFDGSGGCGVTQSGATFIGGPIGFGSGTVAGSHAQPLGDTSCYAYGPGPIGSIANAPDAALYPGIITKPILASVTIDYSALIAEKGSYLNYFGLYYGSIDAYNLIEFMDAAGNVIDYVSGASILAAAPTCPAGGQDTECSNLYVNILLDQGDAFSKIRFSTWDVAVEVDNLAVGWNVSTTNVPEPGSLALIGLGLGALSWTRRRSSKN